MTLPTRPFAPAVLPSRAATIQVFTFKEGLLSRLAHDLCVGVRRFDVELRAGHVRARFDVDSARVDGVVVGERVDPTRFSRQDTEVIERNMRDAILNAARFPSIELEGDVQGVADDRWVVDAQLTMAGRTCPIVVPVVQAGADLLAELDLRPTQWGIPPFTTMGGAIGIQDRWRVRARLDLEGHRPAAFLRQGGVARWGG